VHDEGRTHDLRERPAAAWCRLKWVHGNATRTIYEIVTTEGGQFDRHTRHDFHLAGAPAGEHSHDGIEEFKGRGRGTLRTLPQDAPEDAVPDEQELPEGWWEVTMPPGLAHTFVFAEPPESEVTIDDKGNRVIAVLYSRSNFVFQNGVNTHPRKLTKLDKVR
jgi:hypothetical protein